MHLSGTIVPMATPTDGQTGDVDVATLERFTQTLVDAGAHGLFPGSSIGEFPSLTKEQNSLVVETVVDASDDVPVLAGCCDTNVASVLDRIDAANAAGADAAVVVTPYYLSTNQDGLKRFFRRVADAAPLPVVLYNIPALTGHHIAVDTAVTLARHPNVVGLKDTSGDLTYHHRIITRTPDAFDVYQGATELAIPSLDLGASGLIAGPANVFPDEMADLYDAHATADHETVEQLVNNLVAPLVSATSDVPTAAAVKHLLGLAGLDVGAPLPPLPELTAAERKSLEATYHRIAEYAETARISQ